jgi:mannose-1-phosphate guanylyltransferase
MNASDHRWAVILSTGDGTQASSRTRHGQAIPIQYFTLDGRDPPIREAIRRAQKVVAHQRICVVVEHEHRRHWWPLGSVVPAGNLLVQPRNCGTAIAILFAVLDILDRDPFAQIFFVPAEHRFENEAAVSRAMNLAVDRLSSGGLEMVLIVVEAESPANRLPYVVPGARLQQDLYKVREFLDRPDSHLPPRLCERGYLRSTFLFCAWGFSVVALLREYLPTTVDAMFTALARVKSSAQGINAITELYGGLPTIDFSRTVMQKSRSMMQAIHAYDCGWSDLASPPALIAGLSAPGLELSPVGRPA